TEHDAVLIVKVSALEVPPPGFTTVTCAVPAALMSPAGIAAVSWVALTNVVVRAAPFHCTTEPETKLLPFTVSVNARPPAVALFGESEVSASAAMLTLAVAVLPSTKLTVKVKLDPGTKNP